MVGRHDHAVPGRPDRRLAEADYTDFATDLIERATLFAHLKQFFRKKQIEADDETLVTALSMVCSFSPLEKQALLEAGDFLERASVLTTLLEIGSREDDDSPVRQRRVKRGCRRPRDRHGRKQSGKRSQARHRPARLPASDSRFATARCPFLQRFTAPSWQAGASRTRAQGLE